MSELYEKMAKELIVGNEAEVKKLTQEAIDGGATARDVLDNGLLAGMDVVGKRFKAGDMFIPEVLLCARTMHGAMDILKPLLSEADQAGSGKVVIGTVEGDLHDIGKNLVAMMLQGGGFKVIDLGTNIKPQDFVDAVKEHKPQIVGLSALLTTTMNNMAKTVKEIKAELPNQVVLVGGAPLTDDFRKEIGADFYSPDPQGAVEYLKTLVA